MIKIYFDNAAVFFEFEGSWAGTLLYIGNNKFYLKYKANEKGEIAWIFTAYDYINAILRSLEIIGLIGDRVRNACQMTAQMITLGSGVTDKD